MADLELPPCGLYRTTTPHPEHGDRLPEGRLVHFHNHSDGDHPIVLMPKENTHNVWTFQDRGFSVPDHSWCHTLKALPLEGLYMANQAIVIKDDRLVAEGQLTQLGYNGFGDPILFFPTKAGSANAILFPEKGMKIAPELLQKLTPVRLTGPRSVGPAVN